MRWPKYKVSASASVLPVNTQDWSPLEWMLVESKVSVMTRGWGSKGQPGYGCQSWLEDGVYLLEKEGLD